MQLILILRYKTTTPISHPRCLFRNITPLIDRIACRQHDRTNVRICIFCVMAANVVRTFNVRFPGKTLSCQLTYLAVAGRHVGGIRNVCRPRWKNARSGEDFIQFVMFPLPQMTGYRVFLIYLSVLIWEISGSGFEWRNRCGLLFGRCGGDTWVWLVKNEENRCSQLCRI